MKIRYILTFVLLLTGFSFGQTRIVNQYVSQYNRQATSPGTPPSNTGYLYLSSAGVLTCVNSDGTSCLATSGGGALTTDPLSQFASTTSAQLAGVISNETGSGALVFATSPTFVTPTLGAATATSLTSATYLTATNCSAVGSAASPSVVSCSAAAAGAFSCATNASAATCTVNTSAVTANSQIFVTEVADEGTRLSVTCNTAPSVIPAILVASKSAGVSFTINMPTIAANPACFNYLIVN